MTPIFDNIFGRLSGKFKKFNNNPNNAKIKEEREELYKRFIDENRDHLFSCGASAVGHDEDGLVIIVNKRNKKDVHAFLSGAKKSFSSSYTSESIHTASVSPIDIKEKYIYLDEPFRAYARTDKIRPMQGGISIGHKSITAGTLSMVVVDKTTPNSNSPKYMLLSNNHVLANVNNGSAGDEILQPGRYDGGTLNNTVAHLTRFVTIHEYANVDCAIAEPVTQSEELIATGIYNIYPEVRGEKEPEVGLAVQKSGRTTDTTYGTINAVNVVVDVYYDTTEGALPVRMKDCFLAKIEGAPGDSGSLITTQGSEKKVVGLLFAGSTGYIIGCKWSEVKRQLNIDLAEDVRPVVLDISHHNGDILDVQAMKNNKVLGVFLKCTQGNYYTDDKFSPNWEKLKQAGIPCAPYIFVDPTISANDHFMYFKNAFGNRIPDLPVVLDCEYDNGKSKEQITSVIQSLSLLIDNWQNENFKNPDEPTKPLLNPPIIYTRASWWNVYVLPWSGWKRYGLFVARYQVDKPWWGNSDKYKVRDWDTWLLHQYSADENNDGGRYGLSSRAVDKSIATPTFIKEYINKHGGTTPPPPPPPPDEYKYTGIVLVNNLRIRKSPSVSASIVGYLFNGDSVLILDIIKDNANNTWVKLSDDQYACAKYYGKEYIKINDYQEEPPPISRQAKVIVYALNERNKPSTDGTKVGSFYYGNIINIYEELPQPDGDLWVRVTYTTPYHYCAMYYKGQKYLAYLN